VGRVSGAAVPTSHPHPNRIRRSPSQDATQPVWAPPGSHPHLAIMGKVAVCGPPTASTSATHDQPEQHSCRQLWRSGNTTSTDLPPAAATTTSVVLTFKSARLLQPHMIAGTKIDSSCPTTRGPPEPATPRRPIEAALAESNVWSHQIHAGRKRLRAATNCRIRL
jgi:hypothetical protein